MRSWDGSAHPAREEKQSHRHGPLYEKLGHRQCKLFFSICACVCCNSPPYSPIIETAHGYENKNQLIEVLCIRCWYSYRAWPDRRLCCYSIAALSLTHTQIWMQKKEVNLWVFNMPRLSSKPNISPPKTRRLESIIWSTIPTSLAMLPRITARLVVNREVE